jgi:hypothetical protein
VTDTILVTWTTVTEDRLEAAIAEGPTAAA